MKRWLILEDGTYFEGTGFGATTSAFGEIIFTTGMTGYQETMTSQSANGQIIAFTYPVIGNSGINRDDFESLSPTCKGIVVKEHARLASNWRSQMTLDEFLTRKGIPGISGIDTRALTRKIREKGTMKASIVDAGDEFSHAYDQLKAAVLPTNLVEEVSTVKPYPSPGVGHNVVILDLGLKHSTMKELAKRKCNLTVLPYTATAEEIFELSPDGIIITNGPGNPKHLPQVIETIQKIQKHIPLFGIGLGHQVFALANGADTTKMSFGHHGNHPVRQLETGKVHFSAQGHNYVVTEASLDPEKLVVTYSEINDQSIEGLKHVSCPAMSVQFQPDASPGTHDAHYLFDEFLTMMDTWKEHN
ncbi:carbamoyl phosphate synthase small subunit [Enterococcus sp. LJL98]